MKSKALIFIIATIVIVAFNSNIIAQKADNPQSPDTLSISGDEKLVVMWTSGDREVALKMVFMYTFNAKRLEWWDDITLVVWGPSARLLTEDKELQEYLAKIMDGGTKVIACKGCSDQYGVSEKLEDLGIDVKYIGRLLTDFIKEGRHILTF